MTVLKPSLAETLPEGRIDNYITNDDWCCEQKLDGMRLLVRVENGEPAFLQRHGNPTQKDVPNGARAAFKRLKSGVWYFDGELVNGPSGIASGALWLFDMPVALDKVAPTDPLHERKAMLDGFFAAFFEGVTAQLRLLPTAYTTFEKRKLVDSVAAHGGEGTMFKHLDKPYDSGRRSRWTLKAKNRNTIDCVVLETKLDGKDNMKLGLYDPTYRGKTAPFRPIGECTALAGDGASIVANDIVEVTYLYANDPRAPRLYQPTRPMIRVDKAAVECTMDQLVYTNKAVLSP